MILYESISGAGWTTYTPTITAVTTNPTLGTSTLTGTYVIIGKTVFGSFNLNITTGSGWNQGLGAYIISLPVAMKQSLQSSGYVVDLGTAAYPIMALPNSSTTVYMVICSNNAQVIHVTPIGTNWATGDSVNVYFTYEKA